MATRFCGFLGALDPDARAAFLALGHARRFRRGTALFREGERSDHAIVILEGRVKVVTHGADGKETLLALCGPGDLLGELAALETGAVPRVASVFALDPVVAKSIARDEFLAFLEMQPRAAVTLLRTLACRLLSTDRRRMEFGTYDAKRRLARILVEMAEDQGAGNGSGPIEVAQGVTQTELAGMVSTSRESVGRALAALRERGVVTTARRSITVEDLDALRTFAL